MKPENATDEAPNSPTTAVDRTAWVQSLFIQHSSRIRGYITALTPSLGFVDDVFQETFLTVSAKAGSYDVERDFLPWACGIARFKVMEAGRRAGRAWRPLSPDVIEALCACEPETAPEIQDGLLGHLEKCVKKLAPQSGKIIDMFYQQSHKPAEIAKHLGWTVASVYVALSRARTMLKQCVETRMQVERGSR